MVNLVTNNRTPILFGKSGEKKEEVKENDRLLDKESKMRTITLPAQIQATKLAKACTEYPIKGFKGSKNANFYEFLTMGMVPYLVGSGTMIGVFNLASKFFETPAAKSAAKLGNKMGLGVLFYGVAKTLSKKLIETPVKMKYGIDVNLPYEKVIYQLPEGENPQKDLTKKEYHKVYESVDFPRWDLLYKKKDKNDPNAEEVNRNEYYEKVAKKMGLYKTDSEIPYPDQKVKPLIKEKVVKTKLFSTLSSYLWAAVGVAVAMQKPWEKISLIPKNVRPNMKLNKASLTKGEKCKELISRILSSSKEIKNKISSMGLGKYCKSVGKKVGQYCKTFGKTFVKSCKELFNNGTKSHKYAGRALVGLAAGVTLLGNFLTLTDFINNRGGKSSAASSLFDKDKEKVVC